MARIIFSIPNPFALKDAVVKQTGFNPPSGPDRRLPFFFNIPDTLVPGPAPGGNGSSAPAPGDAEQTAPVQETPPGPQPETPAPGAPQEAACAQEK
jgi:hypothetical protein